MSNQMKANIKFFTLTLSIFFLNFTIHAQRFLKKEEHRNQAVFGELGGNGLVFSVNYDTRFLNKPIGIGARAGIGYFGIPGLSDAILIPLQLNYLIGKNGKYLELGAGGTIIAGKLDFAKISYNSVVGTMNIGFRYQPQESGFMCNVALTPLIIEGFFWPIYGGVGLGYSF